MLLKHEMKRRIEYFQEKVNYPLMGDIITLGKRYPEPTHDNVLHPNSHRLMGLRDEFFEKWNDRLILRILWKILIVKYEHSQNWRNYFDWVFMRIKEIDWKPFNSDRQMECWK